MCSPPPRDLRARAVACTGFVTQSSVLGHRLWGSETFNGVSVFRLEACRVCLCILPLRTPQSKSHLPLRCSHFWGGAQQRCSTGQDGRGRRVILKRTRVATAVQLPVRIHPERWGSRCPRRGRNFINGCLLVEPRTLRTSEGLLNSSRKFSIYLYNGNG